MKQIDGKIDTYIPLKVEKVYQNFDDSTLKQLKICDH